MHANDPCCHVATPLLILFDRFLPFFPHRYFGTRTSPHSSGAVDGNPAYGGGGVVRVALPSSPTDTATAFAVTGSLSFGDTAGPVVASVGAALTGPLASAFSDAALLVATQHPPEVRVLPIGTDRHDRESSR